MITLHFQPTDPAKSVLSDGEIHLWRCHFDALTDDDSPHHLLSADERERLEAVADPLRQRRIAASRIMLRRLLGYYMDIDPYAIALTRGPAGRPDLDRRRHATGPAFNVSHSGNLLLIALARSHAIGVDVEQVRERDSIARVVERCFSERERTSFEADPAPLDAFYRGWTRKEALHKALGSGVFQELNQTEVGLGDVYSPSVLRIRGDRERAREWQLLDVRPERGAIGAIAVPSGQWRLRPLTEQT